MRCTVACCDDESEILMMLQDYFIKLSVQTEITFDVEYFHAGAELLEKYQKYSTPYSMLILDMQMEDCNGIELMEKIRRIDNEVLVLFLTSYPQYMRKSFQVQTFSFMEKPLDYQLFLHEVLRAVYYAGEDNNRIILVKMNREQFALRLNEIQYIQKVKSLAFVEVVTADGTYVVRGNINHMEQSLKRDYFVRISRSCMVNLQYLFRVSGTEIELRNGTKLMISRRKMDEIHKKIARYALLQLG